MKKKKPSLDDRLAKRFTEINLPHVIYDCPVPEVNAALNRFFSGKAVMIWNSRTNELRFAPIRDVQ